MTDKKIVIDLLIGTLLFIIIVAGFVLAKI